MFVRNPRLSALKGKHPRWSRKLIDFQTEKISDSLTVVKATGKLNEMSRSTFFECIADTLEEGCSQIIVDCSGLGLLGSSGLAALLLARKQARKNGGCVYLTHVNSTMSKLLEKTKLSTLLAIYPTTESLLGTIKRGELISA